MKLVYVADGCSDDREAMKQYLELSGFEVQTFEELHGLQMALNKQAPDLLILEVHHSDGDGFTFLKKMKQSHTLPVIFVTGRSAESDRIFGFELGADDYVCKPFSAKELTLRVKALFTRIELSSSKKDSATNWTLGSSSLRLDEESHIFSLDGEAISLTTMEWRIMSYLVANAGILITRSQILEHCFDYSFESYDRSVDTHIKNIRKKIGPMGTEWIETVRGYGYRFGGQSIPHHG